MDKAHRAEAGSALLSPAKKSFTEDEMAERVQCIDPALLTQEGGRSRRHTGRAKACGMARRPFSLRADRDVYLAPG